MHTCFSHFGEKKFTGKKPWSSGLGRWLMSKRSWIQTPAPYTGCNPFASYYNKEKI
jgi:hypothetical protein